MSNYIQVEIGGKLRGLKFSQATNAEIIDRVEKIGGTTNEVLAGCIVIFCGLYINCIIKGVEVDFTFEDVCDWAEGMRVEDINKITECYNSTIAFSADLPKKKTVRKKK